MNGVGNYFLNENPINFLLMSKKRTSVLLLTTDLSKLRIV